MNQNLKFIIGLFVPYSIARSIQRRRAKKRETEFVQQFAVQHDRMLALVEPYSYAAAVQQLVNWGVNPTAIQGASISEASLELCARTLEQYLDTARPLLGLHIGNFLGVSLCYFLDWTKRQHPDSLIVSIDPNITHRGIENTQGYVTRLTDYFALTRQHLLLVGYTLEKNIGEYNAAAPDRMAAALSRAERETAPENLLPHLAQLGLKFDFALIDGNHDASYLERELQIIEQIVAPRALLIVDDVNPHWDQLEKVYGAFARGSDLTQVARDARLGILLKRAEESLG